MYKILEELYNLNYSYYDAIEYLKNISSKEYHTIINQVNQSGIYFRHTGVNTINQRNLLIKNLADTGYSAKDIGTLLEMKPQSIYSILNNKTSRPFKRQKTYEERLTYSLKIQDMLDAGLTYKEISEELTISMYRISSIVKEFNLHKPEKDYTKTQEIINLINKGYTVTKICKELNIKRTVVYSIIRRNDLEYKREIDVLTEEIIEQANKESLTEVDVAYKYDISITTVRQFLRMNKLHLKRVTSQKYIKIAFDIKNLQDKYPKISETAIMRRLNLTEFIFNQAMMVLSEMNNKI